MRDIQTPERRPDPLAGPDSPAETRSEDMARADALRADQNARWGRGEHRLVEAYLDAEPGLADDRQAVLDLIYNEIVLRSLAGDQPRPDEYVRRFPDYAEPIRRQFIVHQMLMSDSSSSDGPASAKAMMTVPPAADEHPEEAGSTPPTRTSRGKDGLLPAAIGKYRVVALLGSGGQGQVYRAVHPTLGHDVVIKLGRDAVVSPEARNRLRDEGRILAQLHLPGLVRVHDLDFFEDRPYLVMEYVSGRTLDQYATQERPTARQSAVLVARTARALAAAHHAGVVHQDIKPQNILVDAAGQPWLIDFGLARQQQAWHADRTEPGSISGTAAYMAPEQARGETDRIGPWSDIFALGGVLYFLLVGQPPFAGRTWSEALDRARKAEWDRQALASRRVPRRLRAICSQTLAPERDGRPTSAEELAADLEAFAAKPRRLAVAGALALALLLVASSIGLFLASGRSDPHETAPAPNRTAEPSQPLLQVRVWKSGRYHPLEDVDSLRTGDKVQVHAKVPDGMHIALVLRSTEGQLRVLPVGQPIARKSGRGVVNYPDRDHGVPLSGPPGTEFVLLCGRRDRPVTLDDVRPFFSARAPWPALPAQSILRMTPNEVTFVQRGRDFGAPVATPDPEATIGESLDTLRQQMRPHFDCLEGLAFGHQE